MMKTDRKQKTMLIKSRVAQTYSETNVPEYNCSNSRAIKFKVHFYLDKTTILKNIELNFGKNQCTLENCNYINVVPNWYKHEFEELNLNTNPNTLFLFLVFFSLIYKTTIKPMWITLPSTANKINIQEICEKREHVSSKCKLSSSNVKFL
ncbi:unnamed protein product [Macrosiphum euphorbiae]|uniref:Uncharacterized protein n=1 Tax=Macrosiphum euphorbiae TaxID=13131 RepID=A0AAV0Y8V1_9HEMI|nr:unnamed protein product [Macrosiphum euphorbiae]